MNIEMIDPPEIDRTSGLETRLYALDEDARGTLRQMTLVILDTLSSKTGTVVLMADVLGNGVAQIIAAGNPALVPPLLYTGGEAADAMFKRPAGSASQ